MLCMAILRSLYIYPWIHPFPDEYPTTYRHNWIVLQRKCS